MESVIGHEFSSKRGLLEWFLNEQQSVDGFKNSIFSGLTALELAKILDIYVIPRKELKGIVHISGEQISKYDLLNLIASEYEKSIKIVPNESLKINRSLNSNFFNKNTGYRIKPWQDLIRSMKEFHLLSK